MGVRQQQPLALKKQSKLQTIINPGMIIVMIRVMMMMMMMRRRRRITKITINDNKIIIIMIK